MTFLVETSRKNFRVTKEFHGSSQQTSISEMSNTQNTPG